MEDLLVEYYSEPSKKEDDFCMDQRFLAEVVFPRIRGSFIVHDDYPNQHSTCRNYGNCKSFPVEDVILLPKRSDKETLDCSCKPR